MSFSKVCVAHHALGLLMMIQNEPGMSFAFKEVPSLKVIFFAISVHKNNLNLQNTAFLLVHIQLWTKKMILN